MPIYEYACQSCEHIFDVLQKMDADPLRDCPECGKPELKKLLSAPNFRLKGGGWYETDFKKDNQRNLAGDAAKKDTKDSPDQNKSDSKKSDSKKSDQKNSDSGKSAGKKSGSSKTGSSGAKND